MANIVPVERRVTAPEMERPEAERMAKLDVTRAIPNDGTGRHIEFVVREKARKETGFRLAAVAGIVLAVRTNEDLVEADAL